MMTEIHSKANYIVLPEDWLAKHPHLQRLASNLAQAYTTREKLVTDQELQQMGEALWYGDISPPQNKIRPVIIVSDNMDIQALPWECLYHPEYQFLARAAGFTVSRHLPAIETNTPLAKGPLRVLLFSALPDDVARLDVEEEQAQVLYVLNDWVQQGWVELEMLDDGRFQTLAEELQRRHYHLVFLSGHGKYDWEDKYGVFCFEDAQGRVEEVRDIDLANAFIGRGVQCVVLSACESAKANTGLAQCLVKQGINHVVGMRESILDKAGIVFAKTFCQAIGHQERVDVAVQRARRAIWTEVKNTATLKDPNIASAVELSQSQWCLPLLFSQNLAQALIDWDFIPQPPTKHVLENLWEGIPDFPTGRFIGRRAELRELGERFITGSQNQLLITAPAGQGKTALATRLAQRLEAQGYYVVTYIAKPEQRWESFIVKLITKVLNKEYRDEFTQNRAFCSSDAEEAEVLLDLLLKQTQGKILFLFDNLESVQDIQTKELQHPILNTWITAITRLAGQGTKLLLTSRYRLPNWAEENHHALQRANILDFTYYIQRQNLVIDFDLNRLYRDLNGNFRAVTFFLKAAKNQPHFVQNLQQAQQELYVDMAIATLFQLLPPAEQQLLARLPAYQAPVPMAGIEALQAAAQIPNLLDYSLLEIQFDFDLEEKVYQVSPLVRDWLQPQFPITHADYATVARYQSKVFYTIEAKYTVSQALKVHEALKLAGEMEKARRFALDNIIGNFEMAGLYRTLLEEWLPDISQTEDKQLQGEALNAAGKICLHISDYDTALSYLQQSLLITREIGDKSGEGITLTNIGNNYYVRGDYDAALSYLLKSLAIIREIGDKEGEGTTLNNISQIFKARGDYDTALEYLQQSLAIQREIGDTSGLCPTLFNMAHIHLAKQELEQALTLFVQVYQIATPIGEFEALQALEKLANHWGKDGLQFWQALADSGEYSTTD